MNTNPRIHLIEIPVGGNGGLVWKRLHSEREDICEAMLKSSCTESGADGEADSSRNVSTARWHRELLQARLRKIDDALDRLMSGSYGNCSKCGRWIEDTRLELDAAMALCHNCWEREQNETQLVGPNQKVSDEGDSTPSGGSSQVEVALEKLQPFDTILIRTLNSDYRILLLDSKTGRALVDGGQYLSEPREGLLSGSSLHGSFKLGSIAIGHHLVMWVDERIVNTSRIQSICVKHHDAAESVDAVTAAIN